MKLTHENLDGMDSRPPTDRDTGIRLSPELEARLGSPAGGPTPPMKTSKTKKEKPA